MSSAPLPIRPEPPSVDFIVEDIHNSRHDDIVFTHFSAAELVVNGEKLAQCKHCGNKQGRKAYRLREHHKKCTGKKEQQNETIVNAVRRLASLLHSQLHQKIPGRVAAAAFREYSIFEPDDLDLEPEVPEYDSLNVRMRAYDYVLLENFAKYVHNTARLCDVDATTLVVPARTTSIKTFKPFSTIVQDEHELIKYERTVQLNDVASTKASLLMEALHHHLPEGVEMTVKQAEDEEDEFRYVPDVMMEIMQNQIDELDAAREERKK